MNILHLFVGFSILLLGLLAANVSRVRMQQRIANGDGGNKALRKAIRAHMNSFEHLLPFAVALFVLQAQGVNANVFAALAFGFLCIRLLYVFSMLFSRFRLRQISAGLTYLFQISAAVLILVNALT